jgi:hypothetical protein
MQSAVCNLMLLACQHGAGYTYMNAEVGLSLTNPKSNVPSDWHPLSMPTSVIKRCRAAIAANPLSAQSVTYSRLHCVRAAGDK